MVCVRLTDVDNKAEKATGGCNSVLVTVYMQLEGPEVDCCMSTSTALGGDMCNFSRLI